MNEDTPKQEDDLHDPKVYYDLKKKTIFIPLSFSSLFKKVSWSDRNKSVKINITTISRVSTYGLGEFIDLSDVNSTIKLEEDIEEVNYRVNDLNVEDNITRDTHADLKITKTDGTTIKNEGRTQTSRLILEDVPLEQSINDQKRFPFDEAKIKL